MKTLLCSAAVLTVGCTSAPAIEDGERDVFLTEDAKADAFGVEDWSPDGRAVLKLVSTASRADLEDDVGLSERVAKSIVAHRATLAGSKYSDLAQLDAAAYVGSTVFKHLLRYAADHKLFKTAIRIPLVVEGASKVSITSFNDKARAAGLTTFARYTFVDLDTNFSEKMDAYDARLAELATKAGIEIDGELMRYSSTVSDYAAGSLVPCFLGDATEVPDITTANTDGLMGDMYSLWGWKYKTKTWIYQEDDDSADFFGDEWKTWDTTSKSIMMMSTNSDSGDNPGPDIVAPCR